MTKDEMIEQLLQQVNSLTATIDAQTQLIAQLNQTIQGLKEQLNKNSKNSSKPPSSDGLKKPAVKNNNSLRESSGKKQGAQEGHDGANLSVMSEPNHTKDHMHSDCTGCPHRAKCLDGACIKKPVMRLMQL